MDEETQKTLKVDDFPLEVTPKMQAAFEAERAHKATLRAMLETVYELFTDKSPSPWDMMAKEMPELKRLIDETSVGVSYSMVSKTITLAHSGNVKRHEE